MLFQVRHSLRYRYERPVFLEPMTVRLTPRKNVNKRLSHHQVRVKDEPAGASVHPLPAVEGSSALRLVRFCG
ncbi:transglutaminase N-terminal domain-containing protein [Cyanobium gracile]|uniref:transglutaminase N-terminal domain-containing protein n=1 Tax=Cyanobium gracile TaxID=59930 RepID=UPI002B1EDD13|nr:transglutaminase N-terminal domain-containing protein [Cyanobium gracile]